MQNRSFLQEPKQVGKLKQEGVGKTQKTSQKPRRKKMVRQHYRRKWGNSWCPAAKAGGLLREYKYCSQKTCRNRNQGRKEGRGHSTGLCLLSWKKKIGPSYIEDILKALRSWLSFNYVKLVRKIKIKNADIPVTLENEEIPSKKKLGDVLNSAPARERVSIFLWHLQGFDLRYLGTIMVPTAWKSLISRIWKYSKMVMSVLPKFLQKLWQGPRWARHDTSTLHSCQKPAASTCRDIFEKE